MHLQTDVRSSGVRGGQRRIGTGKGLPGIQVGDDPGAGGGIGLHRMGQHIKAAVGNQPFGQPRQQIAVQNRHIRPQPPVHQRMLHPVMSQYGKIRHLRAGAGGGRNGRQRKRLLTEIGHCLGAVHGAAAPQCHQQIRVKFLQLCRSLRRQLHRGIRFHPVKKCRLLSPCRLCHPPGRAVFHKKGVRHHKYPFRPKVRQCRNRSGARYNCCFTSETFQIPHRLFRIQYFPVFSGYTKNRRYAPKKSSWKKGKSMLS